MTLWNVIRISALGIAMVWLPFACDHVCGPKKGLLRRIGLCYLDVHTLLTARGCCCYTSWVETPSLRNYLLSSPQAHGNVTQPPEHSPCNTVHPNESSGTFPSQKPPPSPRLQWPVRHNHRSRAETLPKFRIHVE